MEKYDVIIIGAGAAGLLAAGKLGESGLKVLLIEKMERAGRKLRITGKGRCNITNNAGMSDFIKKVHPNGRFLKNAFSNFFSKDIVELLNDLGVKTIVERGGRVFPASEKAGDVVDAFVRFTKKNHVITKYKTAVYSLLVENNKLIGVEVKSIDSDNNNFYYSDNVILASGGMAYPATGSSGDGYKVAKYVGHTIIPVRPALVPLETKGNIAQSLQGLSMKNSKAIVWVNGKKIKEDFGELLFTHFGLSGPIILSLSRFVVDEIDKKNKVEISIDLKPALDDKKLDNRLLRDIDEHGKMKIKSLFRKWLPGKMIDAFLEITEIDGEKEAHQISAKERKKIRLLMKDLRFEIIGYRPFKEAIITAGGIPTTEISSKTMESKIIDNLYFAGEIIDVDGDTGGYNLQIAFSTGWLAAESIIKKHKN
ncbi:MAG: NAD(P)/FAD-dependent oxidoreductase [Bacteroidales bacterium]|nr:NAD(P)/FAD-dependent oxidoreductase [Bacteroidales bacterium]